jgi:glycosyltransferase involved in cell wall biosynthesis
MAKIGIYNQPLGDSLGGPEYTVAGLAEAFGKSHEVELVHHRPSLTTEELEEFSRTDLSAVRLRYVAPTDYQLSSSYNMWRRYQDARKWHSSLSEPYDLFIALVHNVPPFCSAPKAVLMVRYPFDIPSYAQLAESVAGRKSWRTNLSLRYYRWEWKKRLESYQIKTAISDFTRIQTRRLWDLECRVVHPPGATDFPSVSKDNIILSTGRFAVAGEGRDNGQLEMLYTFDALYAELKNWKYFQVGNSSGSVEHRAYLDELHRVGAESHAQVLPNVERSQVRSLFERAGIFWNAAGYSEKEKEHPELAEHFGITTIEAMAAGCVPVVVNRGIQGEIVQHGVNGYLWESTDHLKEYTLLLAHDESLRKRMSAAARERARGFSREAVKEKLLGLVGPLPS